MHALAVHAQAYILYTTGRNRSVPSPPHLVAPHGCELLLLQHLHQALLQHLAHQDLQNGLHFHVKVKQVACRSLQGTSSRVGCQVLVVVEAHCQSRAGHHISTTRTAQKLPESHQHIIHTLLNLCCRIHTTLPWHKCRCRGPLQECISLRDTVSLRCGVSQFFQVHICTRRTMGRNWCVAQPRHQYVTDTHLFQKHYCTHPCSHPRPLPGLTPGGGPPV